MRSDTGIKYYRITSEGLEYKEPYRPERAREKAALHAGNFMFNREQQVKYLSTVMGAPRLLSPPMIPSFSVTGGSKGRSGSTFSAGRSLMISSILS